MWERVGNDPIPPDKIICAPPCRGLITHTDTHTHEKNMPKMYPYKNRSILRNIMQHVFLPFYQKDGSGYQNGRIFRKNSKWPLTPPSFSENYVPICFQKPPYIKVQNLQHKLLD